MKNFAKGLSFFVFGVICSPMCVGVMVPIFTWELTGSKVAAAVATIVAFSAWAIVWSWMINKKWHYHI